MDTLVDTRGLTKDLVTCVSAHAAITPYKPFLVLLSGNVLKQFTYKDAMLEIRRWAHLLRRAGARRGDRVFIALKHSEEIYFAFLGAMWNGSVPTIIPFPTPKQDPALFWAEYSAMLAQVQPKAIVTYTENIAGLRAALGGQRCTLIDATQPHRHDILASTGPRHVSPRQDDLALLQFSSGTTGLRKGVMLTHGQIARHMAAYTRAIGFTSRDTVASWLPLYHDMGLMACFLMPLYMGATIVSLDAFEWVARPWSLLEAIERYRATFTWLPNFAFQHIVRTLPEGRSFDLGHVRAFINCSEPCKPQTFERFSVALGPHGVRRDQLQVCYGMAEAVFAVTQTPQAAVPRTATLDQQALEEAHTVRSVPPSHAGARAYLSCGRLIDGMELRIAPFATSAPPRDAEGCVGEIEVRGGHVFSGYFRNEKATDEAFSAGWYRTGDLGFILDGELFVCGRKKDLIIVHGRNYYAHDIEAIASDVPCVKPGRVVAFGVDDPATGSEEAVVVLEANTADAGEEQALRRAVKEAIFDRLELTVRSVVVVPSGTLVKTTSGKPSRIMNKTRYAMTHAEASQ